MHFDNGKYFLRQGQQFDLREVEVVTAVVDLEEVVSYRGATASLREQASGVHPMPMVHVDFELCRPSSSSLYPSLRIQPR